MVYLNLHNTFNHNLWDFILFFINKYIYKHNSFTLQGTSWK